MRVYDNLQNQVLPNVKAEVTFGHVFPGRFEAIFAGGEIPKTTDTFTEQGGQEGIIVLGKSSTDMVASYGKTRTESRNIVSMQVAVEVTDIQEFPASSLVC